MTKNQQISVAAYLRDALKQSKNEYADSFIVGHLESAINNACQALEGDPSSCMIYKKPKAQSKMPKETKMDFFLRKWKGFDRQALKNRLVTLETKDKTPYVSAEIKVIKSLMA